MGQIVYSRDMYECGIGEGDDLKSDNLVLCVLATHRCVGATCNWLGNDPLGFYIRKHLFEADSILTHLVRHGLSHFGR